MVLLWVLWFHGISTSELFRPSSPTTPPLFKHLLPTHHPSLHHITDFIFFNRRPSLNIVLCSKCLKERGQHQDTWISQAVQQLGLSTLTARLGSVSGQGPKIPPTALWDQKIKMYTPLCSISFLRSQPSALHFITGETGAREILLQGKVSETASLPLYL